MPYEQPKTDRYGCSPRRGGGDSTVTRTCQATGEALLVPARNRRSKVGRITGETGKSAEDERVAAGSVVAMKRSNVRGAKWPCHLQCLQHRGRQGSAGNPHAAFDVAGAGNVARSRYLGRSRRASPRPYRRGGGWRRGMVERVGHSQTEGRDNREPKLRPQTARPAPTLPSW